MKILPRIKDSKVHSLKVDGNTALIKRNKPPYLVVSFDIKTGDSAIIEADDVSKEKLDASVAKAIAWAKHNIKS